MADETPLVEASADVVQSPVTEDAAAEPEAEIWLDSIESSAGGDELLMFGDIPIVVTGSRQKTEANVLSIPVTIITAEDIHYSGMTSLPEILQFASGMQVIRIDRNHYAVGIRGLHDVFSDRTLVLIDGRSAYSPVFGGSEWCRLPVLTEDIKRIEVVRGPAGAAWGANAFNGVINIITKEPEETLGFLGSTTWNEYGDSYSQFRWGAKQGKWSWRTSLGYQNAGDSSDAGADKFRNTLPALAPLLGFNRFSTNDFNRTWITDNKITWQLAPETKVEIGAAYSNVEAGNLMLGLFRPVDMNMSMETTRMFAKIQREDRDGSGGYLQWFGNIERGRRSDSVYPRAMENDLEGQVNLVTSPTNKLSFGGNVRLTEIRDLGGDNPQQIVHEGAPFKEQMVGLFAIDRWQVTDRLTIEGQIRGDWYSETHYDWSGRATVLYAMDEAKRHIVRASGARAFRSPYVAGRRSTFSHIPVGPGAYMVNVYLPEKELRNEEVYSAEIGYDGNWAKGVQFKANGYYQRYNWLIGSTAATGDPTGTTLANIDGADAFGAECELKLKNDDIGELSAWYNYSAVWLDQGNDNQPIRSYLTSPHNFGLTGRLFLPHEMTFNTNFRYSEQTDCCTTRWDVDVDKSFRLDLTLAKQFGEHAELMVGVSDVLNNVTPAHPSTTAIYPHETPGRTFFARFQISF